MSKDGVIDLYFSSSESSRENDDDYIDCEKLPEIKPVRRSKRKRATRISEATHEFSAVNDNILEILSDSEDKENGLLSMSLTEKLKKRYKSKRSVLCELESQNDNGTSTSTNESMQQTMTKTTLTVAKESGKTTKKRKLNSSNSSILSVPVTYNPQKVDDSCADEYLSLLRKNLKKRTFPLSQLSQQEVINTGRTIKPFKAWGGHWPALREFLQNTIDHLHLMDGKTGRRRSCVELAITKSTSAPTKTCFEFKCKNTRICNIMASQDELVIEQHYTYPIASRALDTGVPDTTKYSNSSSSNHDQAGGFGDGFKTASVALIANSRKNDFKKLEWKFLAAKESTRIIWNFQGLTKKSVATFAKCEVLQVEIEKRKMSAEEISQCQHSIDQAEKDGSDYIMKQIIQVKNIGKSFIEEAVPRFTVFWNIDESKIISTSTSSRRAGGDFIGPVIGQPPIFNNIRPLSGVYVRGIWVRQTKIKETMMCFFGNRLEVTGRDRNEVDEDMLVSAIIYVLHSCKDKSFLRDLLEPLRGQRCDGQNKQKSNGRGHRSSWLLTSPRFFNRVIEQDKEYILHNIFDIPTDALFVSRKTTESKDPFISWASSFLAENGTPLIPIDNNANRYLFVEVDEYEITSRCVKILKKRNHSTKNSKKDNFVIFRKLFQFMGFGNAKAFFMSELKMAFVHESSIFIPEVDVTRDLVVKVLNICHSRLECAESENFSSLMQSIFEILSTSCTVTVTDCDNLVKRAKEIKKESLKFICQPVGPVVANTQNDGPVIREKSKKTKNSVGKEIQDCTPTNQIDSGNLRPTTHLDLFRQIDDVTKLTKRSKKWRVNNNNEYDRIIPSAAFEADNAGDDSCLRPSSDLNNIAVDESMGGGHMYCDPGTVKSLNSSMNGFRDDIKLKICAIRNLIVDAIKIVEKSIPTLKSLLQRVCHGYDGSNDTYEAFCDGSIIIMNIFSYVPKYESDTSKRDLIHDLVITITHEIAHFLEPRAGHGPKWRDTHMKMLVKVMLELENS